MIRPAVVGWREWVGLPEIQRAPILAKIDTGAWSNTLHAADIEIIESVPESRIRFKLEEKGKWFCLLYTSPSPRDRQKSRMPSSA